MAKAFWLNERPTWAGKAAKTALGLRANFAEPQLLLGDLAYDSDMQALTSPGGSPQSQSVTLFAGSTARKEYETALATPDLAAALQAEALYKLGKVARRASAESGCCPRILGAGRGGRSRLPVRRDGETEASRGVEEMTGVAAQVPLEDRATDWGCARVVRGPDRPLPVPAGPRRECPHRGPGGLVPRVRNGRDGQPSAVGRLREPCDTEHAYHPFPARKAGSPRHVLRARLRRRTGARV